MNDKVLVSAIIPTYNRAHVVGNALESILTQTYDNIEIIVVDDGSTDNTQEYLKEFGDRIRVLHQPNSGPSAARNRGIDASRGEIIAFLDSDDVWLPTKVERQVLLFQRAQTYIPCCLSNGIQRRRSGGEFNLFDESLLASPCGEGLWVNVTDVLSTRFVLFCQLVAIRRDALERTGYFDDTMRFMEDYDLALRLSIEGPWGFIPEQLAIINSTSADGLCLKVSKEKGWEVCREHYALKTKERVGAILRSRQEPETRLKYLNLGIKKTRRDLWIEKLRSSNYWIARIIGTVQKLFEHYRLAILRRSPWFPAVNTIPIECANRLSNSHIADAASETASRPRA